MGITGVGVLSRFGTEMKGDESGQIILKVASDDGIFVTVLELLLLFVSSPKSWTLMEESEASVATLWQLVID